jgi:hypothetical protein
MAGVLSACSKLEDLELFYGGSGTEDELELASIVDIAALAAGTSLLSLQLPWCPFLTNLAPLGALVNLQSLDIRECRALSGTPRRPGQPAELHH